MPDAASGAGKTDKGRRSLRAGFMEKRTLCPVLKHKVEFARGQGREQQKELSRLITQPVWAKAGGHRSQAMFRGEWKKERKSESSKFPEWTAN